ncbi:hypothetical protein B0H13DRAFT_2076765, partial [Mycena leptocephala]
MSLWCRGFPDLTLPEMFRRLSLPELRQLALRGSRRSEPHIGLSFHPVWMRLECLDISTGTFSRASLADLLNSLPPTMRRLEITCSWTAEISFDDDTLAILTPSHDLSPRCPALQELIMKDYSTISDEALRSFIDGRMSSKFCSPLDRVEVQFGREMQFDILPGYGNLRTLDSASHSNIMRRIPRGFRLGRDCRFRHTWMRPLHTAT